MKNLVLTNHKIFRLKQASPTPTELPSIININPHSTTAALDHTKQIVYYVDDELTFHAYHLITKTHLLSTPLLSSEDDEDPLLLDGDRILNIQYVAESEAVVVIATSSDLGQIISISTAGITSSQSISDISLSTNNTTNTQTSMAEMGFFENSNNNLDDDNQPGTIEVIGQIEGGFSSAQWSPDRELLVLGCNNANIIVMSNQFDVIGESPITGQINQQQQLASSNPYVHLSGTIQNKEYTELTKNNNLIQVDLESDISISWRGDSQYFTTSSLKKITAEQISLLSPAQQKELLEHGNTKRALRVWSRQCTLTSQSEGVLSQYFDVEKQPIINFDKNSKDTGYTYHQGMSRHLAWRPSGNIIATVITTRHIHGNIGAKGAANAETQYLTQQHVQFYERNGLPRYSFPLHEPTLPSRSSGFIVLDLQWNIDSSILAVSMFDLTLKKFLIKFFMVKNYHWTCKYTYILPTLMEDINSVKFLWQYNRSTRLVVIAGNTTIHCLDLVEDNHSSAAPLYTNIVIDGRTIGLTHFSKAAVPPPLSARSLLFHNDIIDAHLCNSVDPRMITYQNSCIRSMGDIQHRIATASTNGMRLDIVSPLVLLTASNELIFPTDAVQFDPNSYQPDGIDQNEHHFDLYKSRMVYNAADNTIKATAFAPESQPERQQGLNRAVSTAKPIAFASLSFGDVFKFYQNNRNDENNDEDDNIAYWRHVQFVHTDQWRSLLTAFNIDNQAMALDKKFRNFQEFLHSQPQIPYNNSINIVTVIESRPGNEYDSILIISFSLDFVYQETTKTWLPKIVIESVDKNVLNPHLYQQIESIQNDNNNNNNIINQETQNQLQLSTSAIELCQYTISRVFTTPHSLPFPIAPEPELIDTSKSQQDGTNNNNNNNGVVTVPNPNPNEANQEYKVIDPELDNEWFKKHEMVLESPPLLSLLTSHGHIIQIPIKIQKNNNPIKTNSSYQPLEIKCIKSQLVPDCLFFMVTSIYGDIAFIGLDQQQRLLINNVVIAPQCLSFSLAQFSDVQSYPLPSTTNTAMTSHLNTTGHGQLSTYLSNQQLSQVSEATRRIPQGLFPRYLFVTVASQQHALFTVDLQRSIDDNINPMSQLRQDAHFVRVVESGTKIVQCIPDMVSPRIIVQQTRGNLEVIAPRSMGLATIFINLLCQQYHIAFRSLRTNKIDLNLLIDHNKNEFIKNINFILNELYLPDNITLLLSSLTNEDCTFLSMENNQYPRYHSMFISQHTMKRLIDLYSAIKNNAASAGASTAALIENPSKYHPTNFSNLPSIVLGSPIPGQVSYEAMMATPKDPITGEIESPIPKTIMENFIHEHVLGNSIQNDNNDQDGFDFNTEPAQQGSNVDDLDLLRKQFQLKNQEKRSEQKKALQGQEHRIKSTAQSFSNRTRAHQAMGNDINNENNKYASNLGEEVGMILTSDGTGQAYVQQLSRVEHWGVGEMDIRHVYSSAERLFQFYNQAHKNDTLPKVLFTPPTPQHLQNNGNNDAEDGTLMLSSPTPPPQQQPKKQISDKTNVICDTILTALTTTLISPNSTSIESQQRQYLLSILTAHLRKSPPDFVTAMTLLQNIAAFERVEGTATKTKSNKLSSNSSGISLSSTPFKVNIGPRPPEKDTSNDKIQDQKLPIISAEKALKYMLILSDKDELWKGAVSTYDLTLAQSVAEHSGRDPKEYIPFLTTLNNISKFGPALTTIQTTSVLVKSVVDEIGEFFTQISNKKSQNVLFSQIEQFSEGSTTELYTPTHSELNDVPLPHALGVALQRAYIDIYLKQYHNVIIHYNEAINIISNIFDQINYETCLEYCGLKLSQKELYFMFIKLAFITSSIYKLIIDYLDTYPYLYHLTIHLYCTPLPQSIPAPSHTPTEQQRTHPYLPSSQSNIISRYRYKLLGLYALWLVQYRQYRDAASIYLHLGQINDAVTCWANAGEYKNVMIYTQRYSYLFPQGDLSNQFNSFELSQNFHHSKVQLYTKLSNVLLTQRKPLIAAQIQNNRLNQHQVSFEILFNAKQWKEAMLYVTNYLYSLSQHVMDTHNINFDTLFIKPLLTHVKKELETIKTSMQSYQIAVERLRLVRLVKQIIFGAQAQNKQCIHIYNKGAIELGNVTGLIPQPRLMLRIPSDDVLEFIITGCWRGVQTGLDVNGAGLAGSLGNFSTATGVTLLSLAPSVAQSIQSISSAFSGRSGMSQFSNGRLSNGSAMSSGQGSMLSLGAAETAVTADERRLKKHMDKLKSKQGRKKVKGGDPREEEKLLLEISYYTPREERLGQWWELIEVLSSCQLCDEAQSIMECITEFQSVVQKEENSGMYIIDTFSDWQQQMIKEAFNWPMTTYLRSEEDITKAFKLKEKEDHDDKVRQELSRMNKNQKVEWDKTQALTLAKDIPLHVYGHRPQQATTAAVISGDLNQSSGGSGKGGGKSTQQQAHKGHSAATTHEQRATTNAQEQVWKKANGFVQQLTNSSLSTLSILTNGAIGAKKSEHLDNKNQNEIFDALLNQILTDLHSTRRTTQLRMDANPFGQKSQSQKVIEHLTQ